MQIDAAFLDQLAGAGVGADVEADDDGPGSQRQVGVGFVMLNISTLRAEALVDGDGALAR